MKHPHRAGLTAAVGAALCLPMLAVTTAATAHEGHDDTAPPPPAGSFQKVTLNDRPGEAIDLAVLPDGDVLHTTRAGVIWHNDADTGVNSVAGRIPVYLHDEEGLQSIALDPGYDGKKNKWIYLYYSPPLDTPADDPATASINEGDAPETGTAADFAPYKGYLTVSRFRFSGGQVDVGSEQKVLDVPVDRGICCHVGGDIVFDSAGQPDPVDRRRHQPVPVRRLRAARRARRPQPRLRRPAHVGQHQRPARQDPADHAEGRRRLHDPRGQPVRPGHARRPARRSTRWAGATRSASRSTPTPTTSGSPTTRPTPGPPTPTGAPPATASGRSWTSRPTTAGPTAPPPSCPTTTSTSPPARAARSSTATPRSTTRSNNTGLRELPPVEQPEVWYSYGLSSEFPELETGGIGPMAGPAYQFDKKATKGRNPVAWPKRYDNTPLFYEWTRDYIKGFHVDDGDGRRDRGRRPRHRDRQPDGHGVRPRRRALRAGVRRRLLRREPRRPALPDRLHRPGRQPQPGPGDRGRADGRQGAADGRVLQRRHHRPGRRHQAEVRLGLRR